ncbi:MAG: hypothetical protein EBU84_07415 [Actinobacteria bacterium]|nr:hypothetical protein [Actinomycetota bacterium]
MSNLLEDSCEPYSYFFLKKKRRVSKANPYKDAQGRFTTKTKAVSLKSGKTVSLSRIGRGKTKEGDKSSERMISRIPDPPRGTMVSDSQQKVFRASVESKARNGSSALLMPRDRKYGTAQVLPTDKAEKRYGKTPDEIADSIRKNGVEVVVSKLFREQPHAVAEMHGVAQAVEEARRMGIPVANLRIVFTPKGSGSVDGKYTKVEGLDIPHVSADPFGGTIVMYSRGKSAGSAAGIKSETTALASGGSSVEFSTSGSFLTQSKLTPSQIAQRGAYGIFIHELGHHVTLNWAFRGESSLAANALWRSQGSSIPSRYGRTEPLEMLAEGFAAWWLMGGSKNPTIKNYYKKWMPVTTFILAEDGLGRSAMKGNRQGYEILKATDTFDRGINIDLLPPDHPLIVWLTNGESIR